MKLILINLFFILSSSVMAQKLPNVQKPIGLDEGAFKEGTITKISKSEIGEFYKWARSARRILGNALEDINRIPVSKKVSYLEKEIKEVVNLSGKKNYQTLMRYALNRGMLLTKIIAEESDMNLSGMKENQLDILKGAIKIALKFYESDLDFQKKLEQGISAVEIKQAEFGIALSETLYKKALNIQDVSAQYRVQYKILEILNWDLVQDRDSRSYSETIVELFDSLSTLNEFPSGDGVTILTQVRKLNFIYARSSKYLEEDQY